MYKRLTTTDNETNKVMILYFEGVLVNFSENMVQIQSEAEAQEKLSLVKEKRPIDRHHMFVASPNHSTKTDRPLVYEIYTRPFASLFLQVCMTRFDIHLVHSYPDYVSKSNPGRR